MGTMADDSPGSRYITLQEEYIKDEQRYVFWPPSIWNGMYGLTDPGCLIEV